MELKEFVMEIAKGIEARLEGVKVTPTETMKYQRFNCICCLYN